MTIQQIQAAIDAKADARQIINMIADYIQANPGGGATPTLAQVLVQSDEAEGNNINDAGTIRAQSFQILPNGGFIQIKSPDGSSFQLSVTNAGELSIDAL